MKTKIFVILLIVFIAFGFLVYFNKYLSKGTLSVSSNPADASIYIQGQLAGTTPYEVKLPEGTYEVKISKKGFEDYETTIDLRGGTKRSVSVSLEKLQYLLGPIDNAIYKISSDGKIREKVGGDFDAGIRFFCPLPGGKRIVFSVYHDENKKSSIWIMDTNGNGKKNLTGNSEIPLFGLFPFPDGRNILFVSSGSTPDFLSLWTIDLNGNKRKITEIKNPAASLYCVISPSGKKILAYSYDLMESHGPSPLWIVDSSGKNLKNLTIGMEGKVVSASFFPNENKVLIDFLGSVSKPQLTGLWVTDSDGKNIKRITKYRESPDSVILSPEILDSGKKIFFVSDQCLWSVNSNGTNEKLVTAGVSDFYPLSNGKTLLLFGTQFHFLKINTNGTGLKQITGDSTAKLIKQPYIPKPLYFERWCGNFSPISPDERKVILASDLHVICCIVSLHTGKVVDSSGKIVLPLQAFWLPEQ